MNDGWDWSMTLSVLLMVGFWVALLSTVFAVTRRPSDHQAPPPNRGPTALEILDRRYASGELSDEEFEAKRRRLRSFASRTPSGTSLTPGSQ